LASELGNVNETSRSVLTPERIQNIVSGIPEEWLTDDPAFSSVESHRQAYASFLVSRTAHSDLFVKEANHARATLI